ncbi:MAG: diguanylate cyclase domain-containing protein [Candidatus Baltobacteraceae bacterium]
MNSSLLASIRALIGAASPEELDENLLKACAVPADDDEPAAIMRAVAGVVREKLLLAREIGALGRSDALTGLPNRAAFEERLDLEVGRGARSRKSFALVLIELEPHGADFAASMKTAAAAAAAQTRQIDFSGRTGERQLALLLVDVDRSSAQAIVARLQHVLEHAEIAAKTGMTLSFPVDTTQTVIERADAALYESRFG